MTSDTVRFDQAATLRYEIERLEHTWEAGQTAACSSMDRYGFLNIGRSKRYAEYCTQDPERYHGESFSVHMLLQVLGN